jgi:predicted deacylase
VVAFTHGNEPVGGLVFERLEPALHDQLARGEVLLVRSNLAAAAEGRRHTATGTDLNRLWDRATLEKSRAAAEDDLTWEHRRSLVLAPVLESCQAILDLHSTSQPTPPFLVIRDDQQHARLVEALGVERVVTGLHEDGVLGGGVTPDVGLYLGEGSDRVGVTFEAGQHTDPENRRRAFEVAVRFLSFFGLLRSPPPPVQVRPRVFEVIDAFRQAPAGASPWQFPGWNDGSRKLGSGRPLASFEPVEAGEVLVRRGVYEAERAASPFTLLLPTPTADPGTDMYYVALERRAEPPHALTRDDHAANLEARAVEHMLDVLGEDQMVRGATWVSFHARQVLDLAADEVLRTLRLPLDHPHRRVALVGRGDFGGDGSEERAGRRYREAFRRVVASGVPVDRYQLLRGATLGWLDALTNPSMAKLMERRRVARQRDGQVGSGLRLFLSVERPSTVAMVVVGDLERCETEEDRRHVRVGLVIEAPIVEVDGASARVRVHRFGLFSAREAFTRTAKALLARLRAEHGALVRQSPLADDPAVQDLIGPEDAIVPPADLAHLDALGASLRDLQVRLWRDALRHEIEPANLEEPGTRAAWLTRTMARTGILDPHALAHLAIDDRGMADPGRLDRDPGPPPVPKDLPRTRIRPPLTAHDADKNTLPRWMGWKRFLHERQVIPESRGEDIELLLEDGSLQGRLTAWMDGARHLAAAQPGRVMVLMAGDGLRPSADAAAPLVRAHTALLLDPAVRYLRVQHTRGSYVAWLKGLVQALAHRPAGAPAHLLFEGDHGASVNLVVVATHPGDPDPGANLEGWRFERVAALVSSLGVVGASRVGVFTEPQTQSRGPNPELLEFARAHFDGLLAQGASGVIDGDPGQAEHLFVETLATWIDRARDLVHAPFPAPTDPELRVAWLQARLGLADKALVHTLVQEMVRTDPSGAVARAYWDTVAAWPSI